MERQETDYGVLLRDSQNLALFVPDTMQIYTLDGIPEATPLNQIAQWLAEQFGTKVAGQGKDEVLADPLCLEQRQALLPLMVGDTELKRANINPIISRLTLNISNACNLWCSYCYADHGFYHAPKSLMPVDRARAIVSKILDYYGGVETVHFFGGEPLMNLAAIDATGEAFEAAIKEGRIERLPQFVATTNGTLSASSVIDTLLRWKMELTISWDGPRNIHDAGRPTVSNGSSYDHIIKSAERFDDLRIPYEIECTYNIRHINAGVSVIDLMDFFYKATGKRTFHIAPASLPAPAPSSDPNKGQEVFRGKELVIQRRDYIPVETLVPLYKDAAKLTVKNLFAGSGPLLSFASNIIEQVINRRRSLIYCPAFFNQLSIGIDGSAYPCFMFIGDSNFRLGNILTDAFPTQDGAAIFHRYFREFGLAPTGTQRWYSNLFGGCVAGEFITTNTLGIRSSAPLYEAMIEECLIGVASRVSQGTFLTGVESARLC
jgi:sulfatase maturation enzyme AslB (radical SAM superfamily)